jgi:sulfur carrier protein ThiS
MERILYVNNDGAGFADYIAVDSGTTIEKFVKERDLAINRNTIRVNSQIVPNNYVLVDGDRVSITPTKIEGGN